MKALVKLFPALGNLNIPNAITTLGLIFCIVACYYLVGQNLRNAVISLFFAGACDLVDGWFAAKLNKQSRFGQSLDSLVDFFSCVIMPVWMVHAFMGDSWLVLIGLVFYCVCGLWRLAFYIINEADKSFTGMPVPSAMMLVVMATWAIVYRGFPMWVMAATFFATGVLMLVNIRLKKYGVWQFVMGGIGVAFFIVFIVMWLS